MMVRVTGQLSLGDALVRQHARANATLERIAELVDWPALGAVLHGLRAARQGAPGYAPVLLLKALLLQQWYGLSDPGLEAALADRLSFRRFVGLALDEAVPDHSTISRFRAALAQAGLGEAVFEAVHRQIDARGLILRRGTLVDATLVEAQVQRPGKPKDAPAPASPPAGAEGAPPAAPARPASKLVASPTDPDAAWAKKGYKRYFGYKGHVAVDLGSGFIRRSRLTAANVADTTLCDQLILRDERAVYADAAYDTKARRAALKAAGIADRIAHRPNRHHPLTPRQQQRNRVIARRRSAVERVFAIAKHLLGWRRVRYRGLLRNACHFSLLCTAINLKRFAVLAP